MMFFNRVKSANIKESKVLYDDNFLFGKDETLMPKFTSIFGKSYAVNVYYLKVQKPELNLQNNCINISLPIIYRKRENQDLLNAILFKMYKKITEAEIENIFEKARHDFGFAPEDYEIRKMERSLATCNYDLQSIFISPYISMYSKEVIEYIVYHEFCHLKYKTHSKKFYELLSIYQPNYEKIAKNMPNLKY
jgi:predicted metal-dependent hydrolase